MYSARVIHDSISPSGTRLTSMVVTFPRFILAEFNTHRMFSRNSASSRAIPVEKRLEMIKTNPVMPTHWGKNQRGMQAEEELTGLSLDICKSEWRNVMSAATLSAMLMKEEGAHKQVVNRLLEPFIWHTVLVTATEWQNFFNQRTHKDAQPEMQKTAKLMLKAYQGSMPILRTWHAPFLTDYEDETMERYVAEGRNLGIHFPIVCHSIARCARVSYLNHEGKRDHEADKTLYQKLLDGGHMSPFEHVAFVPRGWSPWLRRVFKLKQPFVGNFKEWVQIRKTIPGEDIFYACKS